MVDLSAHLYNLLLVHANVGCGLVALGLVALCPMCFEKTLGEQVLLQNKPTSKQNVGYIQILYGYRDCISIHRVCV